jgi:4-amino-4-deoxy-L-arabinose transferase-like glycosyltransferase
LGAAPLERAEIYFLDGARSMVERGDYLVPHYRGQPFFDKPALTYWLMAGSFRLFGATVEAARLVSVVASLLAVLASFWLGRLLFDSRTGLAGAGMLATTVAFISFGRVAMSDMLLTLWTTLAMALAVAAYRPGPPRWIVPALGAVLGLGFLTKGPVALLLPGLGILLLLWRHRRVGVPASGRQILWAAALFLLLGLGWFAALYARLGAGPLAYFFLRENLERFAGTTYDSGREPWYYLTSYLAEGLPWSLFLPVALSCYLRDDPVEPPGSRSSRWLAASLGLMLLPLSVSRGKIDYYLLPLYPAASLIVAHYFTTVPWGRFERVWARLALAAVAAGLAAAGLALHGVPFEWLPGVLAPVAFAAAAIPGAVAAVGSLRTPGPARVARALVAATALPVVALGSLFLPAFGRAQPNEAIVQDVLRERRYRPDAGVWLCDDPTRVQRDLLFHARVAVIERCDLWAPGSSRLPFLLLLTPESWDALTPLGLREIARYPYLPATTLTLRGLLGGPAPGTVVLAANYATDDPVAERKRKRERRRALRLEERPSQSPE